MNGKKTFRRKATLQVFGFQKILIPFFKEFTNMESVIEEAVHFERKIYFRDNNIFLYSCEKEINSCNGTLFITIGNILVFYLIII